MTEQVIQFAIKLKEDEDLNKILANKPDVILTNVRAFKYLPSIGTVSKVEINRNTTVPKVKPAELTRR
ncbi:MAG: hypothetical protein WA667_00905 [Candidatus Nitrosopolaris sp.]